MITKTLKKLDTYIRNVPKAFKALPPAELHRKLGAGRWSKKEILGHLIDSATNNWQRFVDIQHAEQPFQLRPYAQKELVVHNAYQLQSTEAVAGLWEQLNRQILLVCQQLSKEQLQLKIANSLWKPYHEGKHDLAWLINDYVAHMEHHLVQLFGSLEALQPMIERPLSIESATAQLEQQQGQLFITLLRHGTMFVELYIPDKVDLQTPHKQDELYVIISGTGQFFNNGERHPFGPGDVLFVPAGIEHRFEDFSDDFKTWVVFYGPQGGEQAQLNLHLNRPINGRNYSLSSDPQLLDNEAIFAFLQQSYWAKDRPREVVDAALRHAYCLGLYCEGKQVGLARVITDGATFAYLADVYVLKAHQGQGLGKWLVETALEHSPGRGVKSWLLHTQDAQGLYEQFGFEISRHPEWVMNRKLC